MRNDRGAMDGPPEPGASDASPSRTRPFLTGGELAILGVVALIPMLFALYTNNAWEDWYITYRASKNLALGHGLVFTPGERVHSFTSPVGTLLPALLAYLTGCTSDDLVLWLYRAVSSLVLGATGVILFRVARARGLGLPATFVLIGLLAVDPKTVAFSINGMESAFVVLFVALTVASLAVASRRPALWLGVAWGGLMWTRPDGFIYGGAIAAGFLLFPRAVAGQVGRVEVLRRYALAAAVAAVIYAPWILWAWSYYGTFVPHTIVAKGLHREGAEVWTRLRHYPYAFQAGNESTFQPAYHQSGGWPYLYLPEILPILCSFYWILPGGHPFGRAVSVAFLLSHVYLLGVVPFPFPWYWPGATILAILAVAEITEQLARRWKALLPRRAVAPVMGSLVGLVMSLQLALLLASAYQLRWQQALIEDGHRKQIGLWLKANASSPRDTVLMECLGYIGYFSGLKTYDIPGTSSPEVVAARRRLGPAKDNMRWVIRDLKPDWVVLRPGEAANIHNDDPELLTKVYRPARVFNVTERIRRLPYLPGRGFLKYDQEFRVYHKESSPLARSGSSVSPRVDPGRFNQSSVQSSTGMP